MTIASPAGRESFRVESSRIRALSPSCLDKLRALTETREGCDRRGIAALCVSPLRRFRAEGVDPVDCQSTQRNYVRALRRHLFLGARTRPAMTVAKLECLAQGDLTPARIENWHITHRESDGFLFGV